MAYVKVNNGVVVQKQPNKQDGFIEVDDSVVCGMVVDGDDFILPAPDLDLMSVLDNHRWQVETGGISAGGMEIPTRDRDKILINGKITEIILKGLPDTEAFNFVLNGEDVQLTALQIKSIGVAIAEHVQKCVDAAGIVRQSIEDGSISDVEGVKSAFNAEMEG